MITKMFAEESILVAQNWETVEDIIKATEKLQQDLSKMLTSIEHDLTQESWWADEWYFAKHWDSQIYISNNRWYFKNDDSYALWIGVEGIASGQVFGLDAPPQLYIWVWNNKTWPGLGPALTDDLSQEEQDLIDELDSKSDAYVVRKPLEKYRPGLDVEAYGQTIRQNIINFISRYALLLRERDSLIQQHLHKE